MLLSPVGCNCLRHFAPILLSLFIYPISSFEFWPVTLILSIAFLLVRLLQLPVFSVLLDDVFLPQAYRIPTYLLDSSVKL
jgi:hypothetical protein